MGPARFEERQHFSQPWFWVLLGGTVGLGSWGFVQQILLGRAWGSRPAPDAVVWATFLLLAVGVPAFLLILRLDTRVEDDALRVRLRPFRWRTIPYATIRSCAARRYRPIREYGGWGLRYAFKRGWAYSVRGNRGVQLEIEGAKPVLIGSQRSAELADAINAARQETEA